MAKINVVTPTNLGKGIKKNNTSKKFEGAIDNQTIRFNTEGELVANVGGGVSRAAGGLVLNSDGSISINLGDIPTLQTGEHIVKERKAILLPEGHFIEIEVSHIGRKEDHPSIETTHPYAPPIEIETPEYRNILEARRLEYTTKATP